MNETVSPFYQILWFFFGYKNSLFDNRFMVHIAGGYTVSHIASLFFQNKYWITSFVVAFLKEALDHFIFGCGENEFKHFIDILGWSIGGLSYYLIVVLKHYKYKWK